jgi:hypothetical protein
VGAFHKRRECTIQWKIVKYGSTFGACVIFPIWEAKGSEFSL